MENAYAAAETTTIRILAMLLQPDAGTARVLGRCRRPGPRGPRRASLTGQFASVDEDPTGAENLVMIAACSVIRSGAPRRGPVSCARRSAWPRRPACQDVLGR
jgi:ABC-2 type transport system ATP-binding protein